MEWTTAMRPRQSMHDMPGHSGVWDRRFFLFCIAQVAACFTVLERLRFYVLMPIFLLFGTFTIILRFSGQQLHDSSCQGPADGTDQTGQESGDLFFPFSSSSSSGVYDGSLTGFLSCHLIRHLGVVHLCGLLGGQTTRNGWMETNKLGGRMNVFVVALTDGINLGW